MDTKRVGVWCAVSSKPQVEKASLSEQEREGRKYAERVGGRVVKVYRIPGHSRDIWSWEKAERLMPAYRELRQDCEEGRIDVLWCYDPDRLGRDPALAQTAVSLAQKNDVDVFVASGDYQVGKDSTPQRFMFAMQSTQAGVEQQKRNQRRKFGMKKRIKDGLPSGMWAYGYRPVYEDGEVVGGEFDPGEIGAVRLITKLFLEGVGYGSIARSLNESKWKPRRANRWQACSVRYIAINPFYAGYPSYGDDIIAAEPSDKYPVLWDAETWQQVQAEDQQRHRGGKAPSTPVSGVAYCARCGWSMVVSGYYQDGDACFRCSSHRLSYTGEQPPCHSNSIRESAITEAVETLLARLRENPRTIDQMLEKTMPEERQLKAAVEEAKAELKVLEQKQISLGMAVVDGTISPSAARATDKKLLDQIDAVTATKTQAEQELAKLPDSELRRRRLREALGVTSLHNRDLETVRSALVRAGIKVMVEESEVVEIRLF
jgi:site-specific DNA recombinase